jgi:ribosomal protein S7
VQAVELGEEALRIAREIGHLMIEGEMLANLSLAYARVGKQDLARQSYGEAMSILQAASKSQAIEQLSRSMSEIAPEIVRAIAR